MHTSRLRKKVEQADPGTYGNLNESFVSVGTALPSLASSSKKDLNDYKPLWEQEVFDEQGRKRLHGAFTGGFSAGYFNTVGSKEGWTPSTFKSSRTSRAQAQGKSTEEMAKSYMDEEDLSELASARKLETSSTYSNAPQKPSYDPLMGIFGATADETAPAAATAALASLIEPASTRVGAKLMRKMGWRDGQGVGPRVTHEQRKKQAAELGVKLAEDLEEDVPDEVTKHYFAPLDRPLKVLDGVSISSDRGWGLGYKAGPNLKQSLGEEAGHIAPTRPSASAYTDEDDGSNVYDDAIDVKRLDRNTLKVMEVGDEDVDFRSSSNKSKSKKTKDSRNDYETSSDTFHDGNRVLPGFGLAAEIKPQYSTSHLPPQPPRGWVPDPTRVWAEASTSASVKGKGKQLDADERGTMLGEPEAPKMPKSVFDYMSSKDKERLASLTSSNKEKDGDAPTAQGPQVSEPDAALVIPPLDGPTALAALKGFQPFGPTSTSPDAIRQARYTLYLQHCANLISTPGATLPFGPRHLPNRHTQTISEFNRELQDYAQAAKVFKPISGMLAGRFTSGGAGALGPKVEPGLYQPPAKDPTATSASQAGQTGLEPILVEKLTPAQQAARAGRYGDETRTVTQWRPARLVCKRFGERDPFEGGAGNESEESGVGGAWGEATAKGWGTGDATTRTKEALGQESMDALMQSAGFRKFQPPAAAPDEGSVLDSADVLGELPGQANGAGVDRAAVPRKSQPLRPTLETVGLGDDDRQGEETLTYTKAPQDIFAAIFADSDDDDDDDDDNVDDDQVEAVGQDVKDSSAADKVGQAKALKDGLLRNDVVSTAGPSPAVPNGVLEKAVDESDQPLSIENVTEYKPSFVPLTSRTTAVDSKANVTTSADVASKTRTKKHKSSKRKAATLSFDVDDEEGGIEPVERVKKKPKKASTGESKRSKANASSRQDEEGDEWQEAAPTVHPDVLKVEAKAQGPTPIPITAPAVPSASVTTVGGGAHKGRSRASDLF